MERMVRVLMARMLLLPVRCGQDQFVDVWEGHVSRVGVCHCFLVEPLFLKCPLACFFVCGGWGLGELPVGRRWDLMVGDLLTLGAVRDRL